MPTPLPQGYSFRPLTAADQRLVADLDAWAFPSSVDPADAVGEPSPLTWERTVGVHHGDDLVGFHASYPFSTFQVPGGTMPTAGLTWVGVHPTHRRRGLLSAMIDRHLAECRERGEAVSALFAAEFGIYGRFGYGKAADDVRLTIRRGAALHDVPGAGEHTVRIEHASRDVHGDLVARLHREAGADVGGTGLNRPGWAVRETDELQARSWSDPPAHRHGQESRRIIVVERDGEPRGCAFFRRSMQWEPTGPRGTVTVSDVLTRDAAAARALWGALVDLDLMTEVKTFILATDDPVRSILVDPRATAPAHVDNVWVRLVDVPTALAGRRYAASFDVTLAVTDTRVPDNEGVWRLAAEAYGTTTCERVDVAPAEADLALDVRELGAAYLGGPSLAGLAAAGRVTARDPQVLATASTAFGWPVAPVCSWVF